MIDVLGSPGPEERLEQGVSQHVRVEGVFETLERLLTAGVFVQRGHEHRVSTGCPPDCLCPAAGIEQRQAGRPPRKR